MFASLLASRACQEAAQPLSAAAGVRQILQDGFEFELNVSLIHGLYRWRIFDLKQKLLSVLGMSGILHFENKIE